MDQVTVVGAGLAGLVAAITAAEEGAAVRLLERSAAVGGRARSLDGSHRANLGPHVLYKDGPFWAWMRQRQLLPDVARAPLAGFRVRLEGQIRRTPPLGAIPTVLRLRGRQAPVDRSFQDWVGDHADESTAQAISAAAGVFTFHHDPGSLSAAFVWPRTVRTLLSPPPAARYPLGGWSSMVAKLEHRARDLGVEIETGVKVDSIPASPTIIATELRQAAELLDEPSLSWTGARTLCLDLAVRSRRGDPFIVSDLDESGWLERFTAADPSLAPSGEDLFQAQMPMRPGESANQAELRLKRFLDVAIDGLADRETWRRRLVMEARTGAIDMPGTTWEDRPAIHRGGDVFLVGDMVAAPGLLSEVAWASAVEAGAAAASSLRAAGTRSASAA